MRVMITAVVVLADLEQQTNLHHQHNCAPFRTFLHHSTLLHFYTIRIISHRPQHNHIHLSNRVAAQLLIPHPVAHLAPLHIIPHHQRYNLTHSRTCCTTPHPVAPSNTTQRHTTSSRTTLENPTQAAFYNAPPSTIQHHSTIPYTIRTTQQKKAIR